MPHYRLGILCGAPREHQQHASYDDNLDLEVTAEPELKQVLSDELERYREIYGCGNPRGWLQSTQDLPQLKIRRGSTLVSSGEPGFATDAKTCAHCGWQSSGGTGFYDADGRELHFCGEPDCLKTYNRLAKQVEIRTRTQQVDNHQCVYQRAWIGTCLKPTAANAIVCAEHQSRHCSVCGRQATRECTSAGSFVCGSPLCDEHACPMHRM